METLSNADQYKCDESEFKLSTSGRLSLSDITAATIGQLGPDGNEKSPPPQTPSSAIVHRPWADTKDMTNSAITMTATVSGTTNTSLAQPYFVTADSYIKPQHLVEESASLPISHDAFQPESKRQKLGLLDYIPGPDSHTNVQPSLETQELPNLNTGLSFMDHVTPVKGTRPHYDSPAADSRFNESLSNLLGSPPPDSPLSKNPYFSDLQATLVSDCQRQTVPHSLISINTTQSNQDDVFTRERRLQARFEKLQVHSPHEVSKLSSIFRYQSALIETERFRNLHENQYPASYRESLNHYYDNQIHSVMDRVERSVTLLEQSNQSGRGPFGNQSFKSRPHLHRNAIQLMEEWYSKNTDHPYPTNATVESLALAGNINVEQVKKWFANKRNRCHNTRSLTQIAMKKRKLGQLSSS